MATDKIIEILEKVKEDPEFQSEAAKLAHAGDREGMVRLFAETAKRLGYGLTEPDITEAVDKAAKYLAGKTDEAVSGIESLSDEDMEEVSGGADNSRCTDTYRDRENCWFVDACDNTLIRYSGYKCGTNLRDGPCETISFKYCQAAIGHS